MNGPPQPISYADPGLDKFTGNASDAVIAACAVFQILLAAILFVVPVDASWHGFRFSLNSWSQTLGYLLFAVWLLAASLSIFVDRRRNLYRAYVAGFLAIDAIVLIANAVRLCFSVLPPDISFFIAYPVATVMANPAIVVLTWRIFVRLWKRDAVSSRGFEVVSAPEERSSGKPND